LRDLILCCKRVTGSRVPSITQCRKWRGSKTQHLFLDTQPTGLESVTESRVPTSAVVSDVHICREGLSVWHNKNPVENPQRCSCSVHHPVSKLQKSTAEMVSMCCPCGWNLFDPENGLIGNELLLLARSGVVQHATTIMGCHWGGWQLWQHHLG